MKIDGWTLALQTVNVLILLFVLQRFLFKPVLAVIAQRQAATQKLLDDAAAAKRSADAERTALAAERSTLAGSHNQVLADAQAEAQKAREALLAQVAQEIAQRRSAVSAALQRERGDAETALRAKAAALAGDLARRLLERLPAASWNACFIDGVAAQLATLAADERAQLRTDADADVDVVSADALGDDDRTRLRKLLDGTLAHAAELRFSTDAALIAGIELRFRHLVVRNHWAADLDRLSQRLHDDDDAARHA